MVDLGNRRYITYLCVYIFWMDKAVIGGTAGPAMAGPLFRPKMVFAGPLFWSIMIFFCRVIFSVDLDFLMR